MMLLADQTTGEVITIIAATSAALVTIIGAIGAAVKLVIDVRRETKLKRTYASIANEVIAAYAKSENKHRSKLGKPPIELPVDVVPEGSSKPNPGQYEAAEIATMRASVAILKRETGLPPRKEPSDTESKEETDSPGSSPASNTDADKAVEQQTVEKVGERIGEPVVKAAEKKIIEQVQVTGKEIIERLDTQTEDRHG